MPSTEQGPVPRLVRVTALVGLVPMGTEPKSIAVGETSSEQVDFTCPVRDTATCACPGASLANTSAPVRTKGAAAASGWKLTPSSTVLPAGTAMDSGVPAESVNQPLESALMAILVRVQRAPPSLPTRTWWVSRSPGNTAPKSMAGGSTCRWQVGGSSGVRPQAEPKRANPRNQVIVAATVFMEDAKHNPSNDRPHGFD